MAMIFYPFEPIPLCPRALCGPADKTKRPRFALHGLFYRRQSEVAATYARGVARAIITPRRIVEELLCDGVTLKRLCRLRVLASTDLTSDETPSWLLLLKQIFDVGMRLSADRIGFWAGEGGSALAETEGEEQGGGGGGSGGAVRSPAGRGAATSSSTAAPATRTPSSISRLLSLR